MNRRMFCSTACRQRLRYKLDVRSGLLRALNTRYATFYFDARFLFVDILPYDSVQIYSFLFPRSDGVKPAEDFSDMADRLGNVWWAEQRRTQRRYLATRYLLGKAYRRGRPEAVHPAELQRPAGIEQSIFHLKLDQSELVSGNLLRNIKRAYRRQVLVHHPDMGGDSAMFRKIQHAYEDIMDWSRHPTFIRRRGFPDKWFYDGETHRWIQPVRRLLERAGK